MTNKSRKIIKDSEERINKKRERIYKNKKTIAWNTALVVSVYLILCLIIIIYNAKNNTNTNNNAYNNYISTFLALLSMIIIFIFETAAWLNYLEKITISISKLLAWFFFLFIIIGFIMQIFFSEKNIPEYVSNIITVISMIIYIISIHIRYCCELNDEYKNNTQK